LSGFGNKLLAVALAGCTTADDHVPLLGSPRIPRQHFHPVQAFITRPFSWKAKTVRKQRTFFKEKDTPNVAAQRTE